MFLLIVIMYTLFSFFFFNDTATTEIYTLSLHDALPIWPPRAGTTWCRRSPRGCRRAGRHQRSEEHTSELQSHVNLVCRLLLEKKKKKKKKYQTNKKKQNKITTTIIKHNAQFCTFT